MMGKFSQLFVCSIPRRNPCNAIHAQPFAPSESLPTDVSSCSSVIECQIIHTRLIKSGDYDTGFIGDRLASKYAELGSARNAWKLFEEIPNKDLVSCNSLISMFQRRGNSRESLKMLHIMRSDMGVEPNEVTLISLISAIAGMHALDGGKCIHGYAVKLGYSFVTQLCNSLINMYGKCHSSEAAQQVFNTMPLKNLVSWNSMIAIRARNGIPNEGVSCFKSMRRAGIKTDRATIVSLLQAFGDTVAGTQGRVIHGYIVVSGFNSDMPIATALITVYAKSGSLDLSHTLFGDLHNPDRIAWTALLAGYAIHGFGVEALEIFALMVKQRVRPDHVTFIHILSACSHSGLIREGKKYFEMMSSVYGVEPEVDHYSCMVDLLGRSGHLEEACELIKSMPIEPNEGVWGALLGACRVHRNAELGKEVVERLFELNPMDPRNYIILANMCSAAGQWKEASNVRALMKERGLRKDPGCSYIEHGNKVYRFVVGDRSHPESEAIYLKLEKLSKRMQKAGYRPNTDFVLHDVDEEVKEDMIKKHSEKLAIAFGILVTESSLPIMVIKNLRICGDCHAFAKFASVIEGRKIVIRDSKRFHHFVHGVCSCGDYW
ncbi:hypothetical protein Scep_000211 [Stephania cephalantha]|uniref:DYW domain-containing protein n=1 Tax=Stephania cephalantha TaxID=152367 RepID=A0AAP0L6M0_9MAGN